MSSKIVSAVPANPLRTLRSNARLNARLARRAGRIVRTQTRRLATGEPGCFDLCLAISNLSEARRKELVNALERINNSQRSVPVGDGLLYLRSHSDGYPLDVATSLALSSFSQILREAGLQDSEILASTVSLVITPSNERNLTPSAPRTARERLGEHIGRTTYGLTVASADIADVAARCRHGDSAYTVLGNLSGLDASATDIVDNIDSLLPGYPTGDLRAKIEREHDLRLDIVCEQVGTGLGALLLVVRRLGPLLNRASATSSLHLAASKSMRSDFEGLPVFTDRA